MKKVLAIVVAAVMLAGVIGVFAMPTEVPETTMTARFTVIEGGSDAQFSMISEDGELVIFINADVPVHFEDAVPVCDDCDEVTTNAREVLFGRTLAEVLNGRNLEITYNFIGMSIPANTTPVSVTILFETAVHLSGVEIETGDGYQNIVTLPEYIGDLDWDDDFYVGLEWEYFDWENWEDEIWIPELNGEIVVNHEIIEAAAPFNYSDVGGSNVVMVPLRAVAEALGYDVEWNDYTQSIMLGVGIHVFIGRNEVYVGRMAPIELSLSPFIRDNLTFVPLDFVRNALGQNVWVLEGQVVVDSEYVMY